MQYMVEIRINATFLNCESTLNARMASIGRELRFPTVPKFLSRFGDRSYRGNVELFLLSTISNLKDLPILYYTARLIKRTSLSLLLTEAFSSPVILHFIISLSCRSDLRIATKTLVSGIGVPSYNKIKWEKLDN